MATSYSAAPRTGAGAGGAAKSTAPKNATVSRKLQKVLDITLDDNFRDSLEYLSSFYTENTAKERKNLRGLLEKRALTLHENFISEFEKVNELFQGVAKDVDALASQCTEVTNLLQTTQEEASTLLTKAAVLQSELSEVTEKEEQVKSFIQRFQLTPEEKANLKGDITPEFFATLNKVHSIHKNCKELLNVNHQQAGIEIMEEMYMYQLSGYERLFKHTHKQCMDMMLEDTPEIDHSFVTSLNALQERPALWNQCMQEVAKGRRTTILRNFFEALQDGAHPIEEHAQDPLRYIGDMLAWVHQSVAEENELIQNLFNIKTTASVHDSVDLTKADVLDQIFDGMVKHIRTRTEQALSTASSSKSSNMVVLYKMESTLEFYAQAIPQILGHNASLSTALQELKLAAMRYFFDLLKTMSDALLGEPQTVPTDLSAPAIVYDALEKLSSMMETLDTSPIPEADREKEFAHVLSAIIDPLVTLCSMAQLEPFSKSLYNINFLYTIHSTLGDYPFTKPKMEKLQNALTDEMDNFVKVATSAILQKCRVEDQVEAIRTRDQNAPMSSQSELSDEVLQRAIQSLHGYLSMATSMVIPQGELLLSIRMRDEANASVASTLMSIYEELYSGVMDPKNGYTNPTAIAPHAPKELRSVLGLDDS